MEKVRSVVRKTLRSANLGVSNTTTALFRFRFMNSTERSASYAFLYFVSKKAEEMRHLEPVYFCCSPSLLSKDGEYRSRFLPFSSLKLASETQPWKDLIAYVISEAEKRNWNYYTETYLAEDIKEEAKDRAMFEVDSEIGRQELGVAFLAITWFCELFNKVNGMEVNHTNLQFLKISGLDKEPVLRRAKNFYTGLVRKYGNPAVGRMRSVMNAEFVDDIPVKMGQKLVPLGLADVQRPMNIRQKPWRELLISRRAQKLVTSEICEGFPIIGSYYYIHDAQTDLFDNPVQYLRLEHSRTAVGILRKLLEAQRAAWYTMEGTGSSDSRSPSPEESDREVEAVRKWLADKFFSLYRMIGDPVEFTKNEFIMSNVILGVITEYVGRSFYDFLLLNMENEYYARETGYPLKDANIFAKYMFEVLFAMYCANSRIGMIHGDLHLNNCTVHPLFFTSERDVENESNPVMEYVLEGKTYVFASRQYHSVVIDFSRSIIRPSHLGEYEPEEQKEARGKIRMLPNSGRAPFFREQVARVLTIVESLFPHLFSKNKTIMELAIHSHFEELFPTLTAIDAIRFAGEVERFLVVNKMEGTKQHLLSKSIREKSERALETTLSAFLDDGVKVLKGQDSFVLHEVITECFSDFLEKKSKDKKTVLIHSNSAKKMTSSDLNSQMASERARELERVAKIFEQKPLG